MNLQLKILITLIAIILSFYACNTKQKDKQGETSPSTESHIHNSNFSGNHGSLSSLTVEETITLNRKLTAIARENYRSWNYGEPERWKYLSDKFADEVINSYPDASSKKEAIANVLLTHLNQRAGIYNSNVKNKQELMSKSSAEFKYNLSFLIGIEGYQKWQSFSKNELQKFNQIADSLRSVINYSEAKNLNNKMKKP